MINFSILYAQNNLFEEPEGSEEKEDDDDDGLSSCKIKKRLVHDE